MERPWSDAGLAAALATLGEAQRSCAVLPASPDVSAFAAALAAAAIAAGRRAVVCGGPEFFAGVRRSLDGVDPVWVETQASTDFAALVDALREARAGLVDDGAGCPVVVLDAASAVEARTGRAAVLALQDALESAVPDLAAAIVTLFERDAFDPAALTDALVCSPLVLVDGLACRNARYVAPEVLEQAGREMSVVDRLLRALVESEAGRRRSEERQQRYRLLVEDSPDTIFIHSEGAIVYANRAAAVMVGADSAQEVLGRSVMSFVHPDSLESVGGRVKLMLEQKVTAPLMVERFVRLDGTAFYAEVVATPLMFRGKPAIQVIMRDQTERHATEEELQFRSFLLDSVVDGVIVRDPADMCVLYVNEAMCELTDRSRESFFASRDVDWVPGEERDAIKRHFSAVMRLGSGSMETETEAAGGRRVPVELRTSAVTYLGRRALVSIVSDISERRSAQATIEHMALHDPLTGLANRALLADRLAVALAHAARTREALALVFLDVDQFKTINDTAGHGVGDLLLQGLAERLRQTLRADDTVARLGGDEFTLVLPGIGTEEDACRLAEKVLASLQDPFEVGEQRLHVTVSLGVTLYDGHDDTRVEDLLRQADLAMYCAKESGRNAYRVFDPSMNESALERFVLRAELQRAIAEETLSLHYQPIVRLEDGEVLAAEALCRWTHPVQGPIAPSVFIPIAEETGLIHRLGRWVLREACEEARRWLDAGHPSLRVSVNLSPRQLTDDGLVSDVSAALADAGLPAEMLELEITETVAMRDAPRLIAVLRELRELGVRFAIDDFGTGYSSLDYLKQFRVDTIKIDRTFVKDVCEDDGCRAIASAIVSLAQALSLDVVAEGVETEEQRQALADASCVYAQGFLFSHAVPAEEFRALLARLR